MGEINAGSLYDINKNLIIKQNPLSASKIRKALEKLCTFTYAKENNYYMLLNKERSDYTLLHLQSNNFPSCKFLAFNDIKECLENRGTILSMEKTSDGEAFEIWLNINDEAFCYYFFPYDLGVIEVNKIEEDYWNNQPF